MLAGCGGGDDEAAAAVAAEAASRCRRTELVSQANKICREGSEKINAKAQEIQHEDPGGQEPPEEQQKAVADVLEDTAKEYDPYLDQLDDLKPPDEHQGRLGQVPRPGSTRRST